MVAINCSGTRAWEEGKGGPNGTGTGSRDKVLNTQAQWLGGINVRVVGIHKGGEAYHKVCVWWYRVVLKQWHEGVKAVRNQQAATRGR